MGSTAEIAAENLRLENAKIENRSQGMFHVTMNFEIVALWSQHLARFQILEDALFMKRSCLYDYIIYCSFYMRKIHLLDVSSHHNKLSLVVYLCQNLLFWRDYDTSIHNIARCGALSDEWQSTGWISSTE